VCPPERPQPRDLRPNHPISRQYPLRGTVWCGTCGGRLAGATRKSHGVDCRYYGCRRDTGGCGTTWISADNIEACVIGMVLAVAESSDALAMIEAEGGVRADELRTLMTERDETQSKLDSLEDKWANDTISAQAYDRNRRAFQTAIRAAEDRISAIEASSVLGRVDGSLLTSWARLGFNEQRKVIMSLVQEVKVMPRKQKGGNRFDPKRIRIAWRSSALALAAGMENVPEDFELSAETQEWVARMLATANIIKLATA
jgi:hypothetical protein